ncbi:MAG: metal ABC transporter permease [Armatimonadetes bacterium]|nr:metal ABC transporter permease [Armatimonadota bacterium]
MSPSFWLYLIASLAGVTCALSGIYLVLRRQAMLADAISHSILPGLVAGFWIAHGPNLIAGFVGAVAAGLTTTMLVEGLTRTKKIANDSAIGLVFPAMFAIGVIWISLQFSNVHLDTDSVLFGEITLAVFDRFVIGGRDLGPQSVWILLAALVLNIAYLVLFRKELRIATFDADHAWLQGFDSRVIHYSLMVVVTITSVAAFTAIGAILSVALIIVPAVIARLLSNRLVPIILVTLTVGLMSALIGTSTAIAGDLNIPGLVSVFLGVIFGMTLLFSPHQGIIAERAKRARQRMHFAIQSLLIHIHEHENTPEEATESTLEHLSDEFGWSDSWSHSVAHNAEKRGLLSLNQPIIRLTEKGRKEIQPGN